MYEEMSGGGGSAVLSPRQVAIDVHPCSEFDMFSRPALTCLTRILVIVACAATAYQISMRNEW